MASEINVTARDLLRNEDVKVYGLCFDDFGKVIGVYTDSIFAPENYLSVGKKEVEVAISLKVEDKEETNKGGEDDSGSETGMVEGDRGEETEGGAAETKDSG